MATEEIYSLTDANKMLAESFSELGGGLAEAAMQSKSWNIVSRMTSGSGFWKVQNKFRAVAESITLYNKNIKESIERNSEMADKLKKIKDLEKSLPSVTTIFDEDGKPTRKSFADEDIMKMDEFSDRLGAYELAFDGDKETAQKELIKDLRENMETNAELLADMKKDAADAIKFEKANPFVKAKMKIFKFIKLAGNILKFVGTMVKRFLIFITLAAIFIPLIVKIVKSLADPFKQAMDAFGIDFEFIKGIFKDLINMVKGIFKVFQAAFRGDIRGALNILLKDVFGNLLSAIGKTLGVIVTTVAALAYAAFKRIYDAIKNSFIGKGLGKVKNFLGLSTGGTINRGGMAIVGENGPELVSLPSGATVHSNSQSRNMGNTIHVHVNGRVGASDAEIRDIAQKVAREIGLQMNRTTSAVGRF